MSLTSWMVSTSCTNRKQQLCKWSLDFFTQWILLSFSDRGIARGLPGPPGPPGPAGPSGGSSSGYATATIDYTALMRSKLLDFFHQQIFFPLQQQWNFVPYASSSSYLPLLRSRIPLMDELFSKTGCSWCCGSPRAAWPSWSSGTTGSLLCHCVRVGRSWPQFGGNSTLPAEWVWRRERRRRVLLSFESG